MGAPEGADFGHISIHALLAESDPSLYQLYDTYAISIHALLAESDLGNVVAGLRTLNFYPRSPCGERQWPGESH